MESRQLEKLPEETERQYKLRNHVYLNAIEGKVEPMRAVTLSMVFRNAFYLGCSYQEEVMREVRPFVPDGFNI